jgi:hypothetical protein
MMASYGLTGALLVVLDVRVLFAAAGVAGLLACAAAVRLLRGVARAERAQQAAPSGAIAA